MNNDLLDINELEISELGKFTFGDYTINVEQDVDPINPREDIGNFGRMICWHNRYTLGDKHGYGTNSVFIHVVSGLYTNKATEDLTQKEFTRCLKSAGKKNVILPLFLYDHSGITMNTSGFSCNWDSGIVGYIFVSLESIRAEYNVKNVTKKLREKVENILNAEVIMYNNYLTGNVFGYTVENIDNDIIGSCCGFLGFDGMTDDIKLVIEYDIKETPQQLDLL